MVRVSKLSFAQKGGKRIREGQVYLVPWVLFTGKGLNEDLHGWKRGSPRPPEGGCARSCRSGHKGGEGQRLGDINYCDF